MALITPAAFIRFYDARRVCQYLSDSGTPLTVSDLTDDSTLSDILSAASEEVESAVMVGERYTSLQLETLAADTDHGFLLRRLVADLAYSLIISRRGQGTADIERLCPRHRDALRQIEMLRNGYAMFPGIDEERYEEAGQPDSVDLDSPNNIHRVNKFTARAARMFPFDCRRQLNPNECC